MLIGEWTIYYRWQSSAKEMYYKAMTVRFKEDGTFSGKDLGKAVSGTWVQNLAMLSFQFTDSKCTYTGICLNGKSMTGMIAAFDEERSFGDFYTLHSGHHAHVTKKSEIPKDSNHKNAIGINIF